MNLDIFIAGELVDLCIPTKEFAEKSDWYSWFNDPHINKYLEQGLFPNDPNSQLDFFERNKKERVLLVISNKKDYIGVISLSDINFIKRKASVALVVNTKKDSEYDSLIALESMARITEHGFNKMGLDRITAGQHINLSGWQQRMELLGYRLEGILRNGFSKGREITDGVSIAANYDDYIKIIKHRGVYWDSSVKMRDRIARLPSDKFVDKVYEFFNNYGNVYYDDIYKL